MSRGSEFDADRAAEVDGVCDRFEEAWLAGRRPALEEYLDQAPAGLHADLLRELVRLDLDYRCRAGESPLAQDYCRRFPAHVRELLPLFAGEPSPEAGLEVTLEVTAGPHQGQSFTFGGHDTFVVGRSADVHFCLANDRYFSRFHFMVEVNPPLCRLVDLRSHNGTLLNRSPVEAADLSDGDEIEAGQMRLRVWLKKAGGDQVGAAPPPPAQATVSYQASTLAAPVIPGYRLEESLGHGGMGVVYRAVREADGGVVALKLMRSRLRHPDPVLAERFLREAKILETLRHPHIVGFREMGQSAGVLYFAMDYVPGRDAQRLVEQEGPLEVSRAVRLACQLLEALAHAHGRGIIHRDVKPANLLVSSEGGEELARVSDFGLARAWQESPLSGLTLTGQVAGTPAYMPPEQVLNFRGMQPAGDQYAAGATLYTLLTGKPIFEPRETAPELFRQVLQGEVVPIRQRRPDLPEELARVVHKALACRPEDRFGNVHGMKAALQGLLHQ